MKDFKAPTNAIEAFTLAMELAVAAPTDQQAEKALEEARQIAQLLEPEQVHYVKFLLSKNAAKEISRKEDKL